MFVTLVMRDRWSFARYHLIVFFPEAEGGTRVSLEGGVEEDS